MKTSARPFEDKLVAAGADDWRRPPCRYRSSTSTPLARFSSTVLLSVPYLRPCTSACSRNSPRRRGGRSPHRKENNSPLLRSRPRAARGWCRKPRRRSRVSAAGRSREWSCPRPRGRRVQREFRCAESCYSMLANCSRSLSSSAFASTTSREISASFAFDPVVFHSRPISWARNSKVRPTGPSAARFSRNCAKWLSERASSSVMSQRSAKTAISVTRRAIQRVHRAARRPPDAVKIFPLAARAHWARAPGRASPAPPCR